MKLSVSNLFWQDDNNEKFLQKLKDLNIKYLEIAPKKTFNTFPNFDNNIVKTYTEKIKNVFNLEIVSLQSIFFGENANLFNSNQERDYLYKISKKVIDFASLINCENIVFGNPKNRNGYSEDFEIETVQFFFNLGSYAKQKKVIISIEPNPIIYHTNFLNTNLETLSFIQKVNHSNIKMNLDVGSMIYNNENMNSISNFSELINHIHISEPFLKELQYRSIHKDLKLLAFKKFVSIEVLNINDLDKLDGMVRYIREVLNLES